MKCFNYFKRKIVFFDNVRLYSIEKKYRKLCDKSRKKKVEKWIN